MTCNDGYTLSGESETSCTAGTLSDLPTCTPNYCTKPTVPDADITPISSTIESGSKYTVTCNDGYTLSGESEISCTAGTVSELPTCAPNSCTKPTVPDADITPISSTIESGSKYTVTCNDGYTLSGESEISCTAGTVSELPTCAPNSCTKPTVPDADITPISSTIESGSKYTVTCNDGYTLSGESEISCTAGTVSELPTCAPNSCTKPTVPDADITPISSTIESGSKYTVTCNDGYTLSGESETSCTAGTLSDLPTCTPNYCTKPTVPDADITPISSTIESGSKYTVTCNDGYTLSGESETSCTAGTLSDLPTCTPNYCTKPTVPDADITPISSTIESGSKYTVTCNDGYTLSGESEISCTAGTVSELPTCAPNSCTKPTVPDADITPISSTIESGSKYTVTCNDGYTLSGESEISCTAGTVSELPTCAPNSCTKPTVPDADITPISSTIESGSKYTVTCNDGYTLSGESEISCTAGTVSELPTCAPNSCTKPTVPDADITPISSTIESGSKYTVTCNDGYTLSGESETSCTAGTLSDLPTCTPNYCTKPTVPDADITPISSTIESGSKYTVTCNDGYTLSGESEISCTAGTVSELPTCAPNSCTKPTVPDADITPISSTIESGSKYTVTCNDGYTLSGESEISCTAGTVSELPTCTPNYCTKPTVPDADITPISSTIESGSKYTVTCNDGYTLSGESEIPCTAGTVSELPTCAPNSCTKPTVPDADITPISSTIESGSKYTVTCNDGYTLSGESEISCTAGTVSELPTCAPNSCTKPTVPDADITPISSTIESGSKYTVTCNDGYTLSGESEISCTAGTVSELPTCAPNSCTKPTVPDADITPISSTIESGSKYTVTCNDGYTLSGESETSCTAGTLSDLPTCTPNYCTKPTVPDADITPISSTIESGSKYTVTCNDGYTLSGESEISCTAGTVSELPTCAPNSCTKPTVPDADITPISSTIESGSKYTVTCNDGYTLSGESETSCTAGTLSDLPTCTPNYCTKPTVPDADITPISSTIESGSKYTVTCNDGYTLSGESEIPCTAGTVSELPTCAPNSCTKPTVPDADITPISSTIESGSKYTVTCNDGYTLSGESEISCTAGTVSELPTCAPNSCTKPTVPDADITPISSTIESGSKYTVTCNDGYTLSGESEISCTAGTVSELPTCAPNSCTKPTVPDADITPISSTIESGSKYTVTCNDGYTLSGESEISCTAGTVSELPTCAPNSCTKPTVPDADITPISSTIESGSKYTVTCNDGYTLSGESEIFCTTGTVSELPTCAPNFCTKPTVPDADITPISTTIESGSKYTVTCNDGYTLSGESEISCTAGTVSELPTCAPNSCTKPTVPDADITPISSTIESGSKYTVTCNDGYTLSGESEISCTAGTVSELPTCAPNSCTKPTIPDAVITPTSNTIESGSKYTVTCNEGYTITGTSEISCTAGVLTEVPNCNSSDSNLPFLLFPASPCIQLVVRATSLHTCIVGSFSTKQRNVLITYR